MPTLHESTRPVEREKLVELRPSTFNPMPTPVAQTNQSATFGVSPMPGIVTYPDSLRQFYREGIPQYRVIPPRSILN